MLKCRFCVYRKMCYVPPFEDDDTPGCAHFTPRPAATAAVLTLLAALITLIVLAVI